MDTFSKQKIKLGIFVILGVFLFIVGIYLIGKKQSMFGNTMTIYATFDHINGVKEGNNVRFSGINVGTVKDIAMKSDTLIVLTLAIQKKFSDFIRKNAKCSVASDGLVGSMILNIISGSENAAPISQGDTLTSAVRIRTEEMLTTLSVTNENAALLTVDLLKITQQILSGKGVLGAMLRDSSITKDIKNILRHVEETSMEATVAMNQLNNMLQQLDHEKSVVGILKDTTYAKDIKSLVENLKNSGEKMNLALNELEQVVHNADETVLNIKDGDGLINYLSNDKSLTVKVDSALIKANQTLIEFQKAGVLLNRDLQALEHHWLLRPAFKKMKKAEIK